MPFFTTLAVAGAAAVVGVAVRRRPKPPHLVDALIDGEPKQATLLPPQAQQTIALVQGLAQDLFGDTRQQYQQALATTEYTEESPSIEQMQKQNLVVALTGLGMVAFTPWLPMLYYTSIFCIFYSLRLIFQDSYRIATEEHRLDYRAMFALSVVVSLAGGFVWASGIGAVFGTLNWYLAAKTEDRSQRGIADLFGGQIRTAWILVDGVEVETPFAEVQVHDIVVVHAGQMIPVDGTITSGTATVDQHVLTGEAQPVEKGAGDTVLASTVVLSGRLCIHVDKAGATTVASQITAMLSQTNDYKAMIQSRTDQLLNPMALPMLGLSVLALGVVGIEGAAAVLWGYPGYRMAIFGHMSMLSYLQVAAQRGILVKDGQALEVLQTVEVVVFDKTGTLTLEQPTVSRVICYDGVAAHDILRYAAAAEAKQNHPIARAILQAAQDQALDLPPLEEAEYKVGYGLKTQIAGRTTRVGSVRFMAMEKIPVPAAVAAQQVESHAQGHSLILVALDDAVVGALELQPTIRPEARAVIQALHGRGVETVIISGDHDAPTRRLAADLGIDRYFAEVLPEDKANLVTQLQEEGRRVCFVGDGINDSIALKRADVAVSLRGATTIATDMAAIVFMDGTLRQLPELFTLADEFAANMQVNWVASMLPGVVGIAGTFLFGWGMTACVLLLQTSTPVGIANVLKPLLDERKRQEKMLISKNNFE